MFEYVMLGWYSWLLCLFYMWKVRSLNFLFNMCFFCFESGNIFFLCIICILLIVYDLLVLRDVICGCVMIDVCVLRVVLWMCDVCGCVLCVFV